MNGSSNHSWTSFSFAPLTLAQTQPQAGAAPATPAQPVNAVGVPGATSGTTGATTGASQPLPAPTSTGSGPNIFLYVMPAMALLLVVSMMTGRKDKKKRAELMKSLSKGDKVQMIGGEIGTVTDLTPEEVVLRVEEGRIRFARSAVQAVLSSKAKPESASISEVKGEPKTASV